VERNSGRRKKRGGKVIYSGMREEGGVREGRKDGKRERGEREQNKGEGGQGNQGGGWGGWLG